MRSRPLPFHRRASRPGSPSLRAACAMFTIPSTQERHGLHRVKQRYVIEIAGRPDDRPLSIPACMRIGARSTDFGMTWPAPIDAEYGGKARRSVLKMNVSEPTMPFTPAMGNAIPSAFVEPIQQCDPRRGRPCPILPTPPEEKTIVSAFTQALAD